MVQELLKNQRSACYFYKVGIAIFDETEVFYALSSLYGKAI